jgi:hypothetical protein
MSTRNLPGEGKGRPTRKGDNLTSICEPIGAHPGLYPMGIVGSFPNGKAAGAWSWHSPLTSAEVKKIGIYTSTPPYAFMV